MCPCACVWVHAQVRPCVGPSICYVILLALSHAFSCTRCLTLRDITWYRSHMTCVFQNPLLSGSLEKVCCPLPQFLHTPSSYPPVQGYHLSCIIHSFCPIKSHPLIHQTAFAYLVFRGEMGWWWRKQQQHLGLGAGRKRRKEELTTFRLDYHHQQAIFSSTAKPTTSLDVVVHECNPRFREAEAVGTGSKSTWITKWDHLIK